MSNPIATLSAKCALAGVVLNVATDDHGRPLYVVSRWSLTRAFTDLAELDAWVSRVTGKSGSISDPGEVSP